MYEFIYVYIREREIENVSVSVWVWDTKRDKKHTHIRRKYYARILMCLLKKVFGA